MERRPFFLKTLKDTSAVARSNAAMILGKIKDKRAVPALKGALADKDWLVRFRVSQALASIKGQQQPTTASAKTLKRVKVIMKRTVRDLIPLLYDSRAWVSSQAKSALRAIDTPEARKVLRDYERRR